MGKSLVLLSGGIDSTTCLTEAVNSSLNGADDVIALTLLYGQKHARELSSAKAVAAHFGVRHIVVDLKDIFSFSDSPLLAHSKKEVPEGSYAEEVTREVDGISKTYVPYRNGLFLSYAAAVAYNEGADTVWYGAHADDAAGNAYPDCSSAFYHAQAEAIFQGTGMKVSLYGPLIGANKAAVVKWGLFGKAPYHLTWSCYNGEEVACGRCATCRDRIAAFEANGVKDPIPYAQ